MEFVNSESGLGKWQEIYTEVVMEWFRELTGDLH